MLKRMFFRIRSLSLRMYASFVRAGSDHETIFCTISFTRRCDRSIAERRWVKNLSEISPK